MRSVDTAERQSLRGFLSMVERDFPDDLLRIRVPVRTLQRGRHRPFGQERLVVDAQAGRCSSMSI